MGGGASMQGVDDLLATTYVIGKAIAAITFPGMYRIYDFHSDKAPKLKNQRQFSFFAEDSDDEDDDDPSTQPDPSQYEHLFCVTVGEDKIYLEDPTFVNDAGWTALHTCCMSFLTVQAGLALIEETVRRGKSLDVKTIAGPGSFNSQWTALHMACAYGISPLVERLVGEGADVNTRNSFGYNPLLEACHRGFLNIVEIIVKAGADLRYIPSDEDTFQSPFISAPAQSPLGESARCGFQRIVQCLLDAGAPKDLPNSLGWTPLHEACFYNRIDVVKILLLSGADATIRTRSGALPYHLAGLQVLRSMLGDMGGSGAVPSEGDVVDMVSILRELTMPDYCQMTTNQTTDGSVVVEYRMKPSHGEGNSRNASGMGSFCSAMASQGSITDLHRSPNENEAKRIKSGGSAGRDEKRDGPSTRSRYNEEGEDEDDEGEEKDSSGADLIHRGGILGDLPALGTNKKSPSMHRTMVDRDVQRALKFGNSPGALGSGATLDMQADGKDAVIGGGGGGKKNKKKEKYVPPPDMPKAYLCELTRKPMSEPVKTVYGNVYEKRAIMNWITQQGHIDPLTGAPLSDNDLKPLEGLGEEIREYLLERSKSGGVRDSPGKEGSGVRSSESGIHLSSHGAGSGSGGLGSGFPSTHGTSGKKPTTTDDDLYDF